MTAKAFTKGSLPRRRRTWSSDALQQINESNYALGEVVHSLFHLEPGHCGVKNSWISNGSPSWDLRAGSEGVDFLQALITGFYDLLEEHYLAIDPSSLERYQAPKDPSLSRLIYHTPFSIRNKAAWKTHTRALDTHDHVANIFQVIMPDMIKYKPVRDKTPDQFFCLPSRVFYPVQSSSTCSDSIDHHGDQVARNKSGELEFLCRSVRPMPPRMWRCQTDSSTPPSIPTLLGKRKAEQGYITGAKRLEV